VQAIARAPGLPLSFWPGPGAASNPEYAKSTREHPCGHSVTTHVARIPPLDSLELEPDTVVELGPSDEVAREWAVPIDDTLVGVRGDRVLVRERYDLGPGRTVEFALEIAPDGAYAAVELPTSPPTSIPCPPTSAFADSGYARCWSVVDLDSGAVRRLVFEGPCT
jgi:hypothetical protein